MKWFCLCIQIERESFYQKRICITFLDRKPEEKRQLEKTRRRREDNIKSDFVYLIIVYLWTSATKRTYRTKT